MFDPNATDVPFEWKRKDHYSLRIAWLTNDVSEERKEEDREMMREILKHEPTDEMLGFNPRFKGWYMHFNVVMDFHDTLKDAVKHARRTLKDSELNAGKFNLGFMGEPSAPIKLSKEQRLRIIDKLEQSSEVEKDIVKEAMLELGLFALHAWIEHTPYRHEMKTLFKSPSNPVRSLVGYNCLVWHGEGERDDWEQMAEGVLELNGNTVQVGDWSRSFGDRVPVEGIAFSEVSFDQPAADGLYDFIEAKDDRLKDEG
jgi:hypothetical protein